MTDARRPRLRGVAVLAAGLGVAIVAVVAALFGPNPAVAQVTPGQENADEPRHCPEGQVWSRGQCRERTRPAPCPAGQHREGQECAWDPCPRGQRRVAGECVAESAADSGASGTHDSGAAAVAGGLRECDGGWFDSASGLCWQDPPHGYTWQQAIDYCAGLTWAGRGGGEWRVPSLSELRSLIRGCAGTQIGGSCRIGDGCLDPGCDSESCRACDMLAGPGTGGCYWPEEVSGPCGGLEGAGYWSSSSYVGSTSYAWVVTFDNGHVAISAKDGARSVRCVRRGP